MIEKHRNNNINFFYIQIVNLTCTFKSSIEKTYLLFYNKLLYFVMEYFIIMIMIEHVHRDIYHAILHL